eukprot:TRINITY_DN12111_c0_g1_i1.p1 TRINITY_DN12111_c0_g1~~TRINITY_DN12111_c0_g1_i1.p1  ORF type:complete len:147 (+),score=23.29 TRINITY_DN12111_c0_g1_i1:16-456(+)
MSSLRLPSHTRRKFSRPASQRRLMFRTLATNLVIHGQIQTTVPKAKELRRFVDKMVTLGKEGTRAARSQARAFLTTDDAVNKLFLEYADRFRHRNGGYTRIRPMGYREGDKAPVAVIEILRDDEKMDYKDYFVSGEESQLLSLIKE